MGEGSLISTRKNIKEMYACRKFEKMPMMHISIIYSKAYENCVPCTKAIRPASVKYSFCNKKNYQSTMAMFDKLDKKS